jgi:hypothetical protein
LTRDSRYDTERMQAVRLLYKLMEQPGCNIILLDYLPLSLVRVLVALSEQPDDRLRSLAMELICEHGTNI